MRFRNHGKGVARGRPEQELRQLRELRQAHSAPRPQPPPLTLSVHDTAGPRLLRWPGGPLLGGRAMLGCALFVVAVAAAAAVVGLGQIHQLTHDLDHNKSVKVKSGVLAQSSLGGAETILLVGNDTRSGDKYYHGYVPNLANEMLLVRLDPSRPWISMLSLPRELLTTIDCPTGPVSTRLNYALDCGGFNTLVSTIRQVTGLGINHVVEIDFANFEKAIDELGCVYYQVDERYYHVNVPGGAQYQQVNLQPGYQRLCGSQAEQFVSYRHDDTSLVRDARDQTFLLAVKQQFGSTLIDNTGKVEQILGELVSADAALKTTTGIEDLIGTMVQSAGLPVRQVQVPDINYAPSDPAAVSCACITAPQAALTEAADSFLDGSLATPTRHAAAVLARSTLAARSAPATLQLNPTAATDRASAVEMAHGLGVRVEFPAVELTAGAGLGVQFRGYEIQSPAGRSYPAFVEVFPVGQLGQYYDIEGTTWTQAPTLSGAQESIRVGGTTYFEYFSGAHITQVAWYENGAAYWIRNSLTDGVSNAQMLAVAEQTVPVTGPIPVARRLLRLKPPATIPVAVDLEDQISTWHHVGTIAGLLGIVLLPVGLIGLWWRRRALKELRARRDEVSRQALALESAVANLEARTVRRPPPVPPPPALPVVVPQTTTGPRRLEPDLAVGAGAGLGPIDELEALHRRAE